MFVIFIFLAAWEKNRAGREAVDVVALRAQQSRARKENQMKVNTGVPR